MILVFWMFLLFYREKFLGVYIIPRDWTIRWMFDDFSCLLMIRYKSFSSHHIIVSMVQLTWTINQHRLCCPSGSLNNSVRQSLRHGTSITRHTLQWRHNGLDSVSNHQSHDCLLNRLFRRRPKKPSKLRVTGLCAGNSPGTGEFPAQMASNAENVSIWWRHHVKVDSSTLNNRIEENF